MNPSRRLRAVVPLAAVSLLAVALLAPSANAANIPPFTSSAQYQALVKYLEKLNGLANTPTSAAQKATYEDQLENKHGAALNKSTALFNRAKKAAQAESQRAYKAGVRTIRRTEATEMAALRREYDARMTRAGAYFQSELNRIESATDNLVASLRKQIKRLRDQKAKATSAVEKAQIQAAIERRSERIANDRELEAEEVADLRTGYRREKDAIRAAKATATLTVQQNDNEAIETLRAQNTRIYNSRVRTLQSRRANQVGNLEKKLNNGRSAIARMPVTG